MQQKLDVDSQNTVNQRINFLIEHFESGNKSAFGRHVDMKSGVVGDLVGGRLNKPSFEALIKILSAYPSVNTEWLIKGQGEAIRSTVLPKRNQETDSLLYGYSPEVSSYPTDQTNVRPVGLLSEIPVIKLRRVSFKARASFGYAQLQRFKDADIFDTVLFRLPPGKTEEDYQDALVFDIEGDSMEPSLRDGQQVIAWPIPESRWEYLHNTICVVDYAEEVTVKAILKNDLNNTDGLVLHATGGLGGEFTVAREHIHSIWEVREFYGVVPVRLLP